MHRMKEKLFVFRWSVHFGCAHVRIGVRLFVYYFGNSIIEITTRKQNKKIPTVSFPFSSWHFLPFPASGQFIHSPPPHITNIPPICPTHMEPPSPNHFYFPSKKEKKSIPCIVHNWINVRGRCWTSTLILTVSSIGGYFKDITVPLITCFILIDSPTEKFTQKWWL